MVQQLFDNQAAANANMNMRQHRMRILEGLIRSSLEEEDVVNPNACRGWFQHTYRYLAPSIAFEDILM